MRATFTRYALLRAFQSASAVAPSRSPKPVLQNVLLQVPYAGGPAVLVGTDLECGVRASIPATWCVVGEPGKVLLPVDRFGDILKQTKDEQLRIEVDGQHVTVHSDRGRWKMPTTAASEFPPVPEFTATAYHELPQAALRGLLRRTAFAADTDSSRFALGGVKLEFEADKLTAIGCDGRRLCAASVPATMFGEHLPGGTTILPLRVVKLLERSLGDNGQVRVTVTHNDATLSIADDVAGGLTIFARLVEGRFPSWQDAIPRHHEVSVSLPVESLADAVKQAAVMTDEESVGVDFDFAGGMLSLSGRRQGAGESCVEIPAATDAKLSIMLNPRYVCDVLRAVASDTVELRLIDGKSAVLLLESGCDYRGVIMPLARPA